MAGVIDAFRSAVRGALGLPNNPGEPPDLMRLGLYRARVDACAADGTTLDVTPLDGRISPEKGVKLLVSPSGATAIVSPGAVVLLGWERGDPKLPYCEPSFDSGAVITKLVVKAQAVYLGDEDGAEALVKKSEFNNHVHTGPSTVCANGAAWTGSTAPPTTPATGTTQVFGL